MSAVQTASLTVPMTGPFVTNFAFQASDLKIPEKKLYSDFLCKFPLKRLNFEGWALSPALFEAIPTVTRYVTQINMGDTVGINEDTLMYLKGLPKMRVFIARGALEFNETIGRYRILVNFN